MIKKMLELYFVINQRHLTESGIKGYCINLNALALLGTYGVGFRVMHNSEQRVIIHGSSSQWGKIPAGVP